MIKLDFSGIALRLKHEEQKTYVFDSIRKKWVVLTPEEHVRQYMVQYILDRLEYPRGLVAIEKKIFVGKVTRRFDIAIYDNNHKPWMLIECPTDIRLTAQTPMTSHQLNGWTTYLFMSVEYLPLRNVLSAF